MMYTVLQENTMVTKAVLLKEIDTLPPRYFEEVVDFIGYIREKKIKEYNSLEKGAEMAADDYCNDKELTVFSV